VTNGTNDPHTCHCFCGTRSRIPIVCHIPSQASAIFLGRCSPQVAGSSVEPHTHTHTHTHILSVSVPFPLPPPSASSQPPAVKEREGSWELGGRGLAKGIEHAKYKVASGQWLRTAPRLGTKLGLSIYGVPWAFFPLNFGTSVNRFPRRLADGDAGASFPLSWLGDLLFARRSLECPRRPIPR
jgi:hypothetical protein